MQNRVKAIAKGNIEWEIPEVVPERDLLQGVILPDRKMTMEVAFRSANQVPMQLHFYAHEPRIACSSPVKSGETGKLVMDVDTNGLKPGDRLEGFVDVVYNGGEMKLRYQLSVGLAAANDTEIIFRKPEEFYRFAKKNPDAAAKLFAWKEFLSMPFMQDLHLRGLYGAFRNESAPDAGLSGFFPSGCTSRLRQVAEDEIQGEFPL